MANKNALLHSKMLLASIAGLVLLFVFGAIARSKVSDRAGAESKTRAALASNPGSPAHADAPARPERNPDREAYFGETHVHTSWSFAAFAAFVFGNHVTGPADSYKYFKGETIKHPLGTTSRLRRRSILLASPTTPNTWARCGYRMTRILLSANSRSRQSWWSTTPRTFKEFICGWALP